MLHWVPRNQGLGFLAVDIEAYDGVRSAVAYLTGPGQGPSLYIHVRTEYDTELTTLRHAIATHALPRMRSALELDTLLSAILITRTGTRSRTR